MSRAAAGLRTDVKVPGIEIQHFTHVPEINSWHLVRLRHVPSRFSAWPRKTTVEMVVAPTRPARWDRPVQALSDNAGGILPGPPY